MTWKIPILAAFIASLTFGASPARAQETVMPQTVPLALDPADTDRKTLGELTYRGGLVIEPGEEDIGGISGLEWWDGKLYAVTEDGRWLIITPDSFRDELVDLIEIEIGSLRDERGKRLKRKGDAAANAITRDASGGWLVGYTGSNRLLRHASLDAAAEPVQAPPPSLVKREKATAVALTASAQGALAKGASCAENGVCYVLVRELTAESAFVTTIVAVGAEGNHETVASWSASLNAAKFEGIAVREENAQTYLYLVSDNNFSGDRRNLMMKFEVSARAASAPGIPEKVFETTIVELETSMGNITVSLETERAPITVANFLRYIDEDRFNGTKCYRAMHVKGGEQPAGFLQCGTQNHPDRILDGIAHEPTNETGLKHTNGALSMARFEPGTATGDFSIMIRDQPGLDAQPDAEDSALRPGFAVFGYVVEGMDVVHAIHATKIDPDKGTGFLKGQMLAEPITIVSVNRAEAE